MVSKVGTVSYLGTRYSYAVFKVVIEVANMSGTERSLQKIGAILASYPKPLA